MKKQFYPALFEKQDVGYTVSIPSVPGCISQGDTLEEAIDNITEALGLFAEEAVGDFSKLPEPKEPEPVSNSARSFYMVVTFDWFEYQKKHDTKCVRKTLTIPAWLNAAAEEQHINFSSVLKSALISVLHN